MNGLRYNRVNVFLVSTLESKGRLFLRYGGGHIQTKKIKT